MDKEGLITNLKSAKVSIALIASALIVAFTGPSLGQSNETSSYWFQQGMALYEQDRFSESLDAYEKALELDPTDSEAWNNRGIDLGLLGRYDEALESFERAVALNESYAEAWYNMGVIYDYKGYYYTAVQAYKKATQINPSYQKALVRRNIDTDIVMGPSLSCSCSDQLTMV
jgi:tetratricopeptide (TPR) repeat protein